ncbi:hypothetical protein MPTK1_5g16620 [Marchantia polymorpha subsp. ruderalis]|uniref:4Fe-4S ferredoxin-type domain-containing protein n=2 Tax=Marchantia polymorpha TaxID=3197 RepID=A0AAF6BJ09_MARPO|nr:hypothetical protein MARPO_0117s0044 [Marchantia polymorpha]BBN11993.1 hypothetical protein Mp_5g16620 [Marchantia polymorpha subsp. ruderalis]|eukprot:PTQ30990.1 hypothetical protein MARPO_0117s0044 [Marchantia polymorpha]
MDTKVMSIVFMASATLLIFVLAVNAEDYLDIDVNAVSSPASPRRRFLLNVTPARNTCKYNKSICRQAGSAGPDCCDEVCVDKSTDFNNCGSCGHDCHFGKTCCDGDCVDLQKDEDNCGRCGLKCPRRISTHNLHGRCENGLCDYN